MAGSATKGPKYGLGADLVYTMSIFTYTYLSYVRIINMHMHTHMTHIDIYIYTHTYIQYIHTCAHTCMSLYAYDIQINYYRPATPNPESVMDVRAPRNEGLTPSPPPPMACWSSPFLEALTVSQPQPAVEEFAKACATARPC